MNADFLRILTSEDIDAQKVWDIASGRVDIKYLDSKFANDLVFRLHRTKGRLEQALTPMLDKIQHIEKTTFSPAAESLIDKIFNKSRFKEDQYLSCIFLIMLSRVNNKLTKDDLNSFASLSFRLWTAKELREKDDIYYTETARIIFSDFLEEFEYLKLNVNEQKEWLFAQAELIAKNPTDGIRFALAAKEEAEAEQQKINNQKNEEAKQTAQTAVMLGLPELTGSPKQKAWAEKIRKIYMETKKSTKTTERILSSKTTAKYWIDNHKEILWTADNEASTLPKINF